MNRIVQQDGLQCLAALGLRSAATVAHRVSKDIAALFAEA